MSSVFSKNRGRRSRSSTSESNTFVKNVTSRVSGLLPATITKWFSSPRSSANGSAAAALTDGSDSSTEEEGPESPITQPPSKRMRYSPGTFSTFNPAETPPSPVEPLESQPSQLYEPIQPLSIQNDPAFGSAQLITPEDISRIEVVKLPRRDSEFKIPHPMTGSSPSVATKRKSIFESTGFVKSNKQTSKPSAVPSVTKESKPSFKPALFGSPFYPGRTMYGGASSSSFMNHPYIKQRKIANVTQSQKDNEMVNMSSSARRVMDLLENYSSPLMEAKRIPMVKKANMSALSDSFASTTASHGYSYKTQELHIPSIASIMRVKQRARLMDTTKVARQIIASHSSTLNYSYSPSFGKDMPKSDSSKPIEKESTTKMKTRLTRPNRGEDPLELPEPVQMPTAVLQIDKNNLPKFSFSEPTTTTQSSAPNETTFDSYLAASVGSQPTNTSMSQPLFTFSSMNAQSSLKSNKKTFESRPVSSLTTSTPKISTHVKKTSEFIFSSPVTISTDSHQTHACPKFTFGSPDRTIDDQINDKLPKKSVKHLEMSALDPKNPMPIPKSSSGWKCPECWIVNKEEAEKCASCTTKRPSKDVGPSKSKCSMCKLTDSQSGTDKCVNCEMIQISKSVALPIPKPADPTKWKCGDCWVSNDGNMEKCACCGSCNPNNIALAAVSKPAANDAQNNWKCEDCWISNKSSVEKCAACGGAKPGTKASTASAPEVAFSSPFARPPDEKLFEIAKAQKEKWECPSCLVRNESNKSLCACCGMERPGPTKKLSSKPTFNFGITSNTSFKFGIDPKVQETQETNLEKKKEEPPRKEPTRKLEEPETNNNTVSKTSTFSFGSKPEDKLDSAESVEAPKQTFSFGIPKQSQSSPASVLSSASTVSPAPTFTPDSVSTAAPAPVSTPAPTPTLTSTPSFGTKVSLPTTIEEKSQEVPKVDLTAPAQPAAQFTGYFAAPKTTQEPAKSFTSFMPNSQSNEKKDPPAFSFGTSGASSGSSNFTFNSGGVKASGINSVPLFGNQDKSVASTSSVTFGTVAPPTTTAPPMMFQKPEATVHLFQASEPATNTMFNAGSSSLPVVGPTPTPDPTPATAPLFNFGNNAASLPADKPKFNFSFGSNAAPTSEPSFPSFKPVFGQTENASTAGPFGTINTLAAGNGLNANTMGGNTITNNTMGNADQSVPLFGSPAQTDNVWGSNNVNNSGNLFGNGSQKPASFTFGAPNPFNASQPQDSSQGPSASQAPMFGGQSQASTGLFGNGSMFPSATPIQPTSGLFGNTQQQQPARGIFGAPSQPMAAFEPQPQAQPQPAFNFGAPQPTGVFGFGSQGQQQQSQSQPQPAGVYSFGGGMNTGMGMPTPSMGMGTPQMGVQFNMGSAPVTNVRRMRKAVRRNPQR